MLIMKSHAYTGTDEVTTTSTLTSTKDFITPTSAQIDVTMFTKSVAMEKSKYRVTINLSN